MTAPPPVAAGPLTVLLIEDNPDDVFLLEALIRQLPSDARPALVSCATLAEGLARLGEMAFDLVLADLGLPDSNGVETVLRLQAVNRQVPVVVLTGLDDDASASAAVMAGAQDYLTKGDVDARGLRRTIRHALERHRLRMALEQSRAEEAHRATHDELTGLPNRALLLDRLGHALAHATRERCHVGVAFIDLDGFKRVNDRFGHQVGDALLVYAAGKIGEQVRRSDTLARLGGDEFVILFEKVDHPSRVANLLQALLSRVEGPVRIGGHDLDLRLSLGSAVSRVDGDDAETLLAAADARMYLMKGAGRR